MLLSRWAFQSVRRTLYECSIQCVGEIFALKAEDESMCWDVDISNHGLHIGKLRIVKHPVNNFSTRKTIESITEWEALLPNSPRKSPEFSYCRHYERC